MEQKNTEEKRKLSRAEQERLARFEEMSAGMEAQGYKKTLLTVSIVKANLFAILLAIPLFALGIFLFFLKNGRGGTALSPAAPLLFLLVLLLLVVVHELVHGLVWALFAEHHFRDISFGVMRQFLTPYCSCAVPLRKGHYLLGALMPLLLLGVLPALLGIGIGSFFLLLLGLTMIVAAAGDMMIAGKILAYRSTAQEIVYIDHPTEAGSVIFER